ncbi:MAG TPA: NAD(P)-dependent oxidoreductase [Gaiellaceae bacterium]|nr:NAD(P)-dependent oxidoreductase [Gaiellaceae bacterium]
MSRKLALLGTGLIGAPAARRLAAAGVDVTVWNRTPAAAAPLRDLGIGVAETPAGAVAGAEAVLLFLLDEDAVAEVLERLLPALAPDALVVDFATTSVAAAERFEAAVNAAGGRAAVAPFFGSVPEVERGDLYAVCGGAEEDDAYLRELLGQLCSGIHHAGSPGSAAALKLALNVLVFPMVELIGESLALAQAQGVDPERVLEVLAEGTGVRSPIYSARGRMIADGDYAPRATVELATKDLALIAAAAAQHGLELPLAERTRERFDEAAAAGHAGEDMAAVAKLITGASFA